MTAKVNDTKTMCTVRECMGLKLPIRSSRQQGLAEIYCCYTACAYSPVRDHTCMHVPSACSDVCEKEQTNEHTSNFSSAGLASFFSLAVW